MLRISCRRFSLLRNTLKLNQFDVVKVNLNTKNCKSVRLTSQFNQKSFYSKDAKETNDIKSPLTTLIQQQQQQNEQKPPTTNVTEEAKEKQKNKEKSWKHMKYTLMFFGFAFTCGGLYLLIELGRPKRDEYGEIIIDRYSDMPLIKQYFLRTFGELNYYGQLIKEPSREKLLPDMINHPMYHPQYTLVLEFTDVLVHPEWTYNTGWRFKKRPGLDTFLESLHGTYEIVVYTAEQGMTVFPIVDTLDPKNLINYKLVRDATLFIDGKHVKDLDKLNRDLSKVIVIDWNPDCTKFHRENVLRVPRWKGRDDDTDLLTLSSFLTAISQSQIEDVRDVLKAYQAHEDPLTVYRERQKRLIERAEADAEEERGKIANQSPIDRWKPSFLKKNF